jgi:hypothetical protein
MIICLALHRARDHLSYLQSSSGNGLIWPLIVSHGFVRLSAKQVLIEQLRQIAADDPDFLGDLVEGETSLIELIGKLDASIIDDEVLVEGAKTAAERLTARRRSAENRIDLKRRLLAHALREFWARAPADALGVKKEIEKALQE